MQAYSAALKVLCQAEKSLHDTIRDSYEAEWPEREQLTAIIDVSFVAGMNALCLAISRLLVFAESRNTIKRDGKSSLRGSSASCFYLCVTVHRLEEKGAFSTKFSAGKLLVCSFLSICLIV